MPWDAAEAAIEAADGPIVLVCHVDPDGDALGAMLALHLHLRRSGVDSHASIGDDPLAVPQSYAGLPGVDTLTRPEEVPDAPALLITLDLDHPERLGSLRSLVDRAGRVLVIDHHRGGEGFGDIALIDPDASSTVAIVERLLRRLGADVDADVAACLYVGLVTDTARFQHPGTDPDTHALAGRLLATGLDHTTLSRRIFDTHSFGYLKLVGRVLDRAVIDPEHRLVASWFSEEDLERAGVSLQETEPVIDLLRTVDTTELTLLAKRVGGAWRGSLRSTGDVDVAAVARRLGGGGHAHAAGFRTEAESFDALLDRLVVVLDGDDAASEVA
jgi:bifunctional oligoribonuclease and PAP phosphatase NrnA